MLKKTRTRGKPQEFDPQEPPGIEGVTGLTLVGRGGSASVYKGQESALRRTVAVKILHTQLRAGDEQQAFRLECEHAGQVGEHPYAADVYRNGFADGWPFLVMRYYARGSLASTLRFAGQQRVAETLTTCVNVATALQYAHNLGILHRDVKPENILCDAYGAPVLADFGIATSRDAASRTLRHAMTPAYAAPEVLQHGGGWPHSDVWSLAATLYALLSGHPPFYDPRGDPQANLRALGGPLPAIGRPDVPGHVLETLSRALVGRPDTRTASARRFAEELNASLELLGAPPVPILVDAPATGALPVHPGPVPLLSPLSAATENNTAGRGGPYPTSAGFTTTTGPAGFAGGHATRPPQPLPQAYESTGTVNGLPTGYLSTNHAYRQPGQPGQSPGRSQRKRVSRVVFAGGAGVLVLVILAVAYLLAAPKHPAADTASSTSATSAAATSVPATSTASAPAQATSASATSASATSTASASAQATSTSAAAATGPPVVSSVAVSAVTVAVDAGAEVDVTATVNPGGEPLSSCTVTVTLSDDGGSGSGACGSAVIIDVPMYNTSYTATVTATDNDGTATGTGTGTSSLKELAADASTAFGAGNSDSSADETDESVAHPVPIIAGTVVTAECWATGLGVSGDDAAYPSGTDYYDWIEISSPDIGYYMPELYFPDPAGVTAGLPSC